LEQCWSFTGMMTKYWKFLTACLVALIFIVVTLLSSIEVRWEHLAEPIHIGDTVIIRSLEVNGGLKTCRSVVGVSPSGKYIQINNCDYTLDRDAVLEVVEHKSCGYEPG
jgi:hypothetical protein